MPVEDTPNTPDTSQEQQVSYGAGGQIISPPGQEEDARRQAYGGSASDDTDGDYDESDDGDDGGSGGDDLLSDYAGWEHSGLTREQAERYAEAGLLDDFLVRAQYLSRQQQQQQPGQRTGAPAQQSQRGTSDSQQTDEQRTDESHSLIPVAELELPEEIAPEMAEPLRQVHSYYRQVAEAVNQVNEQNQFLAQVLHQQMQQQRVAATEERLRNLGPEYEDVLKGERLTRVAKEINDLSMELEQGAAAVGRHRTPSESYEMAKEIVLGRHQANIARTAAAREAKQAKGRHTSRPKGRRGSRGGKQNTGNQTPNVQAALDRAKAAMGS